MALPDIIGPYELLGPHGRGGMGVVYEARARDTGARVAVKAAQRSALAIRSLRHEIWALSRLDHRGVVAALDHGEHDGIPWVALEWLEPQGAPQPLAEPTLHDLLDEGALDHEPSTVDRMSVPEARRFAGDLCRTLAYLHEQGVAHCDLKPGNIMLRGEEPVLVDFGLWSHAHGTPPRFDPMDRRALTRDVLARRQVAGTLAYVAPETLASRVVDARADLFSLGCIFYELLTGSRPGPAPIPPRELRDGIPADLEALVLQLLHPEPRHRPGFAADVAGQLLGESVPGGSYVYRAGALVGHIAVRDQLAGLATGVSLVTGEAGSGRTRLALEVAAVARDRRCRTYLHSFPEAYSAPLEGFAEVLDQAGRWRASHAAGEAWPLTPLVPFQPTLAEVADGREEIPKLSSSAERERIFGSLEAVMTRLHEAEPYVVVMDDLQWADGLTLAFLAWLGDRQPRFRIVATLAQGAGVALADEVLAAHASGSIELRRLGETEVGDLAAQMLADEAVPAGLGAVLERRSSGNPLFVSEYLSTAVSLGLLVRREGMWRVPGQVDADLPLPLSIREVVERRIEALDEDGLRLAQCVAVVGSGWSMAWLGRGSGMTLDALRGAVGTLLRHRILALGAGGTLAFTHNQLRHAAYATLSVPARRELHRIHAELLVETGDADDAVLAHHYISADRTVVAQVHLLSAARSAVSVHAQEDAIQMYGWYISSMDLDNPESIDACLELASLMVEVGRTSDALPYNARAGDICRRQGNRLLEATVLGAESTVRLHLGEHAAARDLLTQSSRISQEVGDLHNAMMVEYRLWWLENNLGRLDQALERVTSAVALADQLGERLWGARLRSIRGQNLVYLGRTSEAVILLQAALDELVALEERDLYPALGALGLALGQLGEPERAALIMDQALENCRAQGKKAALLNVLSAEAYRRAASGQLEAASAMAAEIDELAQVEGARIGHIARGAARSYLALHEGDIERALAEFEAAKAIQERDGIRAWASTLALHELMLYRRAGRPVEVLEALISAHREVVTESGDPESHCAFLCEVGHIALLAGRSAAAAYTEAVALVGDRGIDRHHRSASGWALARLHRAMEAEHTIHGECLEDLPERLRATLEGH